MLHAVVKHHGLKVLDMRTTDLASMEPGLLASVAIRMQDLRIGYTKVTRCQAEIMLISINDDSQLKTLDMRCHERSLVEPGLLTRAVNRLEDVQMWGTPLTREQIEAILTQSLVKTSLRRLWIINGDVAAVDGGLLLRARSVIRNLDVSAGPGLALGGLSLVWL